MKLFDPADLASFPTAAGVYLMKSSGGTILYVGKAKNLRQRLKQYFVPGRDSRLMIPFLINKVVAVETIVVLSEKEALLLENTLIKEHKPRYNALLKDDKTYAALRIDRTAAYPKLEVVRMRSRPKDQALYFGPYTGGASARNLFDFVNALFPLRQCSDAEFARRQRPCILYDMKRCLAPCVGRCSPEEYRSYVNSTIAFLQGRNKEVIEELRSHMLDAADALDFEQAALLQKRIAEIESAWQGQSVEKYNLPDTDAFGLFRKGATVVVCQLLFRCGKLVGSQAHRFENILEEDDELLTSLLLQIYSRTEALPAEILLPQHIEGCNAVAELLAEQRQRKVSISVPQRGEKLAIASMAQANAAAEFHKKTEADAEKERILLELQERLHLKQFPRRIECIDTSHMGGSSPVAAIVSFCDGVKDTKGYRSYNVKDAAIADDYSAMREVLLRRLQRGKSENNLPDLLLIDGGKGHLHLAEEILASLDIISINVIGIAKEDSLHTHGLTREQLFLPGEAAPLLLERHSPILHMLQTIRDEAHRSAITLQKKKRSKKLISTALEAIPGIGPIKSRLLLRQFGSVARLKEASPEALSQVKGINKNDIAAILRLKT